MKTGVVMEIEKGWATVLQPGGGFAKVRAEPGWLAGDVVQWSGAGQKRQWPRLVLVAACLLLMAALGVGMYGYSRAPVSYVSLDINPSVELALDRQGRVVTATAYNTSGETLLGEVDLKGLPYEQAMEALLESQEMQPYLAQDSYLLFSVYSPRDESGMVAALQQLAQSVQVLYPGLLAECKGVQETTLERAHHYGMTAGRMLTIEELQQLDDRVEVEEYRECGIEELHEQVQHHHQRQGQGNEGGQNADGDETASAVPEPQSHHEEEAPQSTHGGGHGGGHHGEEDR